MIWLGKKTTRNQIIYLSTTKHKNSECHRRPVLPDTVFPTFREWPILSDGQHRKQYNQEDRDPNSSKLIT